MNRREFIGTLAAVGVAGAFAVPVRQKPISPFKTQLKKALIRPRLTPEVVKELQEAGFPGVELQDKTVTIAEARAASLAAAQARYLPPNRPLTLEEVNALDADEVGDIPCFVEVEPNWYEKGPDDVYPRLRADVMCKGALDCATYNKHFRGWLRKPTQEEMDAAGWGDAE